ncbi:MAG: hypothetical protein HYZ28_04690 [Myxococcales bacterium]|nr:hypothetical protein [Myxococcales bacterium]
MAKGNGKAKSLEQQIVDRLDQVVAKIERGFEDLNASFTAGLRQVNERLDKVIENTGGYWRDHEERLRRLEERVGLR